MKKLTYIAFILVAQIVIGQSSVLADGEWYKVGITETGLYKLDRSTLDILGVPSNVDPRKISLFGNGVKGILPQANEADRPVDLIENAIYVQGESDGSFDNEDVILFYGVGPHKEEWTEAGFEFENNIYSDTAFYFIRISDEDGKRIESKPTNAALADITVSTFDDHIAFEDDRVNLILSGRKWLGELLSDREVLTFSHQIDGLASNVTLTASCASQSGEDATFDIAVDDAIIGSIPVGSVLTGPDAIYSLQARQQERAFTLGEQENFSLDITYNGNESGAQGFLDWYTMTFQRNLQLYQTETDFRVIGNAGFNVQYEVENASSASIWNVTDPTEVMEQEFTTNGNSAVFRSQSTSTEEFAVFSGSDFPTPFVFGTVSNQNLRTDVSYDGLIITPSSFLSEANRLAQFHSEHDNLRIKVVPVNQVYNEFSSGRQDLTAIRDYAKHVYDEGGILKYLLLFGDCSYDYKSRVNNNTNFIPTYESRNSFDPLDSYSSDDYFAFFEEDEGEWAESFSGDHTMDIGVGRLPIKSLEEAAIVIDKITYYSTSSRTLGKWKNEITYFSDDGDSNTHAIHAERLGLLVDTTYAQYNISKLLLDAFDQESNGSTDLSPQATTALKTRIKEGTFTVNYMGHGNEEQLTEEEVFTNEMIEEFTNGNKLPVFLTATCQFGRYDNPVEVSGAEELVLRENAGAIAILTTSRDVVAFSNFEINQAFHENFYRTENGQHLRLGDIIRLTKNEGLFGVNNRNFTLLGDPMMMPAFPKLDIVLDEFGVELDTLSALEEVSFSGVVQSDGAIRSDFNGQLSVSVFDTKQSFQTKGQESDPYTYTLRNNALFRGEALVENGTFEFSFIVPKNISYQYETGKISLYAWDEENNLDADGSSREIVIGGTNENAVSDTSPPSITMYLNDETFSNGGTVGRSSLLIADLSDESGITTAQSGVVEGITLELDGEVFNLNNFYTASAGGFTEGSVVYPIQDLEPGYYVATLKVWDTHNNASTSTIDFEVTGRPTLFVFNEVTYPNPVFNQEATFYFEHDREDEDIRVDLYVYNGKGEVVSSVSYEFENSLKEIEIPWIATTNSGQQLNQGIYYYRLIIRSDLDGATKEIAQKLVIVN